MGATQTTPTDLNNNGNYNEKEIIERKEVMPISLSDL
jgi:hypothetical protein